LAVPNFNNFNLINQTSSGNWFPPGRVEKHSIAVGWTSTIDRQILSLSLVEFNQFIVIDQFIAIDQ
jgi:hypothetical protein